VFACKITVLLHVAFVVWQVCTNNLTEDGDSRFPIKCGTYLPRFVTSHTRQHKLNIIAGRT